MKLSIITVVTDKDAFKSNALVSFYNAKKVIDTTQTPVFNKFKKIHLVSAINLALQESNSDFVAVIHQDALISVDAWQKTIVQLFDSSVGLVGYAGIRYSCSYSDCYEHGLPISQYDLIGRVKNGSGDIIWDGNGTGQIHSPDDFAFCFKNVGGTFLSIQRSQHHYAADLSIRFRLAGYKVVGISSDVTHDVVNSKSTSDAGFFRSLVDLRSKWHNDLDEHLMPHSCWSGNRIVSRMPMTVQSASGMFQSTHQIVILNDTHSSYNV